MSLPAKSGCGIISEIPEKGKHCHFVSLVLHGFASSSKTLARGEGAGTWYVLGGSRGMFFVGCLPTTRLFGYNLPCREDVE
jgi:hypothetical protein